MGLLLGGSVLTLCEILDFIIHSVIIKLKSRTKKYDVETPATELTVC